MKQASANITAETIARATWIAQKRIVAAIGLGDALRRDAERKTRQDKGLCPYCYYARGMRIGGAAMTFRACGLCQSEQTYGSTVTDALCLPCAKKERLCKHCGGDLDAQPRPLVRTLRKTKKESSHDPHDA